MSILIQCLAFSVTIACVLLTYFLGRRDKNITYKRSQLEKRYLAFHVPFIKLVWEHDLYETTLSQLIDADKDKIVNFLIENIHFADINSIYDLFMLLKARSNINKDNDGNSANREELLDYAFNKIARNIFEDATMLSKQLYLPDVAQPLLRGWRALPFGDNGKISDYDGNI